MSHNYYLHRDGDPCPECGQERAENVVVQIGHSGGGWVFLWRGWRTAEDSPLGQPVTTPTEWFAVLADETRNGAVIKDSYGKTLTLGEFIRYVAAKRQPRNGKPALLHNGVPGRADVVHVDGDDIGFHAFE